MKPDLHLLARSRYTWGGFMLAAYFSSAIWYGDGVFTAPVHLILFAPYGLITLFHLVGLPDDEGTRLYCWAGLHVLFWPLFVAFMWSLPRFFDSLIAIRSSLFSPYRFGEFERLLLRR